MQGVCAQLGLHGACAAFPSLSCCLPLHPTTLCAQELAYGEPGVLGYAATWPQAAAALPQPGGAAEFDWEGDRPLGLPMEDLVRAGRAGGRAEKGVELMSAVLSAADALRVCVHAASQRIAGNSSCTA